MVDAFDAEHVQRLPDVGRRPLLAGVRDLAQPELLGRGEDLAERARRVPDLGRVKPDAGDDVEVRVPGLRA